MQQPRQRRQDADESPASAEETQPAPEATEGDVSLGDVLDDPGSYQSNHGNTGFGDDDDHADPDDAKVQGRGRD
jgi:hypothetical protein